MGPVIKCFVTSPNSKIEEKLQRNCLLDAAWLQNLLRFQGAQPDHVEVKSSTYCFPRELVSFVCPRYYDYQLSKADESLVTKF